MSFKPTPGWIAVPTGTTPRFNEFWERLLLLRRPPGTGYSRAQSPDNGLNRNKATVDMLAQEPPQWCYYLDDDHEFEMDDLYKKLEVLYLNPDIDVLAGFYVRKYPPYFPVLFHALPPDEMTRLSWEEMAEAIEHHQGLVKVLGCGGGGLLVRRRVLEKLRETHGDEWFETGPRREWGPDIGFCIKLRDAGFKIVADLNNPLGHMIGTTMTPVYDTDKKIWTIAFTQGGKQFRLPVSVFQERKDPGA